MRERRKNLRRRWTDHSSWVGREGERERERRGRKGEGERERLERSGGKFHFYFSSLSLSLFLSLSPHQIQREAPLPSRLHQNISSNNTIQNEKTSESIHTSTHLNGTFGSDRRHGVKAGIVQSAVVTVENAFVCVSGEMRMWLVTCTNVYSHTHSLSHTLTFSLAQTFNLELSHTFTLSHFHSHTFTLTFSLFHSPSLPSLTPSEAEFDLVQITERNHSAKLLRMREARVSVSVKESECVKERRGRVRRVRKREKERKGRDQEVELPPFQIRPTPNHTGVTPPSPSTLPIYRIQSELHGLIQGRERNEMGESGERLAQDIWNWIASSTHRMSSHFGIWDEDVIQSEWEWETKVRMSEEVSDKRKRETVSFVCSWWEGEGSEWLPINWSQKVSEAKCLRIAGD